VIKSFSITTMDLLASNPLLRPANCTSGIPAGMSLCLPQVCQVIAIICGRALIVYLAVYYLSVAVGTSMFRCHHGCEPAQLGGGPQHHNPSAPKVCPYILADDSNFLACPPPVLIQAILCSANLVLVRERRSMCVGFQCALDTDRRQSSWRFPYYWKRRR
jgi:hypothetical protein